jgi:hypothetical protein
LLAHRLKNRHAPVFKLAQVFQPFVKRTKLRIVKPAGRLFAVPRHERNRGATVEQFDRCLNLFDADG